MAIRLQMRKDSPAVWDSANPTLRAGEIGYAWDSSDSASFGRIKIGDGTSTWTQLAYFYSSGDSAGLYSSGGGGASSFYGDRGLSIGGQPPSGSVSPISYVDITSLGNAQDFGDMVTSTRGRGAVSSGSIAVAGGGTSSSSGESVNNIEYFAIASLGNATDFGDISSNRSMLAAAGDTTRGIFGGGYDGASNIMEYITIAAPGNATDFGDLSTGRDYLVSSADLTYSLFGLGQNSGNSNQNSIEYVTTQTTGNAADFGDATTSRSAGATGVMGNTTRGLFAGGGSNVIDYVTIATPGNATDFGDLTSSKSDMACCSNGTRGLIMGSGQWSEDMIDYVTIATPGNAADFGDMITSLYNAAEAGASGNAA